MKQIFLGLLMLIPVRAMGLDAPIAPSREFPPPRMVEGQPFEVRPPERPDDKPLFPEQTRAPYHKSASYKVTTITDKLSLPWSVAFLPDGKMLVTEKFPGRLRIVSPDGALSEPLSGINELAAPRKLGLLDVVLAPSVAKDKRVYFSFFENLGPANSNTHLAFGTLDEAAGALHDVTVI